MSIKNQAIKGMVWNTIERFSSQGIQFVLTIVIARLLSPADYGLVAMISIFIVIAETFVDSGFCNALIQKKDRTEVDYSTMFYFNIIVSVLVYMVLFISAPWIATFYNQPELTKIVRVLGLYLITNSLGLTQKTRLAIALDFKKLAIAVVISVIISSCLGVWMAYNGYGVWTLVFQTLLANVSWVICLWLLTKWIPKRCFSWDSCRSLFSFGSKLLFSSLLHTLYLNMYSLVIGKFFSVSILGYFNRAYTLGQFPAQNFGNIVQKVLYPIQCSYQDDDEKFNKIFISYLRISSFVLFPLMIGFAILATPVVTLLLTEKWLPTVPLLQIICLSMMWLPIMQANVSVLDAKGRGDYHLRSELVKKILAVLILFLTLPYGLKVVCLGMLLYSFVDISVAIYYSRRLTFVGYKVQLKVIAPILLLALSMGAVVYGVTYTIISVVGQLIIGVTVGGVFYLCVAYLFKLQAFKALVSFLKRDEQVSV